MSGTRRANEPAPIFRRRRPAQPATGNVTVVAKETPHADTQVIEPVPPQPTEEIPAVTPALAQEIREALDATDRGETEDLGDFTQYAHEPIPDLYSADPADRTEWLKLHEGYETDFAAVLNDHPEWLYLIGLPEPVRTAPEAAEDTTDSGPGTPPAGEAAVPTAAAPPVPGPVSTEDEPAKDEPDAAKECAE